MISAEKVFGSYVKRKIDISDISNNSSLSTKSSSSSSSSNIDNKNNSLLQCAIPQEWTACTLLEIRKYNHDTSIFRFQLPNNCTRLDLSVGSYLLVKSPIEDNKGEVNKNSSSNINSSEMRPYTSISDDDDVLNNGCFEILCKRYDEWGKQENVTSHFLFTKTDHSYKSPGE